MLKNVEDVAMLYDLQRQVSEPVKALLTNFYIDQNKLNKLICSQRLLYTIDENQLLLFVRHEHYFELYYFLIDIEHINIPMLDKPVVCNIFESKDSNIISKMKTCNFIQHSVYNKMILRVPNNNYQVDNSIGLSFYKDKSLFEKLYNDFDEISDCLPEIAELEEYIQNVNRIAIIKQGKELGYLIYKESENVSILEYIYNSSAVKGIGTALINQYFLQTKDRIKRYELWVRNDNLKAISLYDKFGYHNHGVKKTVLIRE